MRDKTICNGYARAMKLLLDHAGIESYFTSSDALHAWNIVKCGNYYFHLDACHDGETSTTSYHHFLKSDADIRKCNSGHTSWVTTDAGNQENPRSRINDTYPNGAPTCPYSMGDANKMAKQIITMQF